MEIKPIRNAKDHDRGLREIERLWGSARRTPHGDRLEVMIALVMNERTMRLTCRIRSTLYGSVWNNRDWISMR
jgi:hypothetical protein